MTRKPDPTPEEALAIVLKQREYMREYTRKPEAKAKHRDYMREYQRKPEVKAKRREHDRRPEVREKARERKRQVYAGYLAAKKAGLI